MEIPDLARVLILATHPDDDVIGAGGLMQRVMASNGALRVVFITGGERNDWPQRAMLRKWSISDRDRREWARLRRGEAECALDRIGAGAKVSYFLEFPDQQISDLARRGDEVLRNEIASHISDFNPTLVMAPSYFDVHTDHRASSYFAHKAVDHRLPIATYLVHGTPPSMRALFTIHLTPEEQKKKRDAIACHETQLLLSRGRFLGYARATETFYAPEYDVVCVDTPLHEKLIAFRHGVGAVLGAIRR